MAAASDRVDPPSLRDAIGGVESDVGALPLRGEGSLDRSLAALIAELGHLHAAVASLRLELGGLRQDLRGLSTALASAQVPAIPTQPSQGAASDPIGSGRAQIRERAMALQHQLRRGLSQGIDPAADAGLDLLIDQMHDLAAEL